MEKINTHGLTIKGLRKASGKTENYSFFDNLSTEVFYEISSGEIWTKQQYGKDYTTYVNWKDIIRVCRTSKHLTMQRLADLVFEAVEEHNQFIKTSKEHEEYVKEHEEEYNGL